MTFKSPTTQSQTDLDYSQIRSQYALIPRFHRERFEYICMVETLLVHTMFDYVHCVLRRLERMRFGNEMYCKLNVVPLNAFYYTRLYNGYYESTLRCHTRDGTHTKNENMKTRPCQVYISIAFQKLKSFELTYRCQPMFPSM